MTYDPPIPLLSEKSIMLVIWKPDYDRGALTISGERMGSVISSTSTLHIKS